MTISIQGKTGWASIPNSIGRSRLPHPTVHLLVNLLTHADGFDATYATITKQTGMAPATISTALANLQKLGIVTVKKVAGTNGRFDSNHYIFHADRLWKLDAELVDASLRSPSTTGNEADGESSTATGNEAVTATGNEAAPLQEMKRKNNQEETPSKNDQYPDATAPEEVDSSPSGDQPIPGKGKVPDDYIPEFKDWYNRYPRKMKPRDAFKAWWKAVRRIDPQELNRMTDLYAEWCRVMSKDKGFIPYPATWLNGDEWNNELVWPTGRERAMMQAKAEGRRFGTHPDDFGPYDDVAPPRPAHDPNVIEHDDDGYADLFSDNRPF